MLLKPAEMCPVRVEQNLFIMARFPDFVLLLSPFCFIVPVDSSIVFFVLFLFVYQFSNIEYVIIFDFSPPFCKWSSIHFFGNNSKKFRCVYKFDNFQCNTMGRWDNRTIIQLFDGPIIVLIYWVKKVRQWIGGLVIGHFKLLIKSKIFNSLVIKKIERNFARSCIKNGILYKK